MATITNIAKAANVNRNALKEALIKEGYLISISEATQKGIDLGISKQTGERDGQQYEYLVYSKQAEKFIKENIPTWIQPAADTSESTAADTESTNTNPKYKYLGLTGDFVLFDTETTGLDKDDEIIELAVLSSSGKILFNKRFCPEKAIHPMAAKCNHLSKKILENEPKFSIEDVKELVQLFKGKTIVGHNVAFDIRLLAQTVRRYNLPVKEDSILSLTDRSFDTKLVSKKFIKTKSYALNNLTTLVGITREEQHNAADDCLMTLEFLNRLEDILEIRNDYDFMI